MMISLNISTIHTQNKMLRQNKLIIFFTIFNLFCYTPKLAAAFKSKDLENFQDDLNDLITEILPQNVSISANKKNQDSENFLEKNYEEILENFFENKNNTTSIGSGFFISESGLIATNYHVVEDSDSIEVSDFENKKYSAKLISFDKKSDLALLKIESENEFKSANFANSNETKLGNFAILVGNPFDLGLSLSRGMISAKNRLVKNANNYQVLQIDGIANKGNSGGAIFNIRGEVIGITSAIFSPNGSSVGITFALPSNLVKKIIEDLKENGEVIRGSIGISIQELTPEIAKNFKINRGIFVTEINDNSPSAKAKMQASDIILKFNDKEIKNINQLIRLIENYPINKTAKVKVWRNGEEKTLEVKIEKQEKNEQENFNQFQLNQKNGLIKIKSVDENSNAAKKGLKAEDILLTIDGVEIKSVANAQKLIKNAIKEERKILLVVKRENKKHALTLSVK